MKAAFPKNRNRIEKAETKRDLLNTFSYLFTGMVIQSAKYGKWADGNKGAGQGVGGAFSGGDKKNVSQKQDEISLADVSSKGPLKSKRKKITMKYSPLVDRYLFTHKYETMNNVRGWKMLLTQRTEAQAQADRKLKAYEKMKNHIQDQIKKSNEEY